MISQSVARSVAKGASGSILIDELPRTYVIATAGEAYQSKIETGIADPCLRHDGTQWVIYYASTTQDSYGHEPSFRQYIRRMTSLNGRSWTRDTAAALTWSGSGWDAIRVETPTVVYDGSAAADRRYKLYYSGAAELHPQGFPNYKVGLAISADGITFSRFGTTPILDWDDFFPTGVDGTIADPEVIYSGGFYHLYATCYARDAGANVLGFGVVYAFSAAGEVFTPVGMMFAGDKAPSILHNGTNFEMYYTQDSAEDLSGIPTTFNPAYGTWRTNSTDLINWTEELSRPFVWDGNRLAEDVGMLVGTDVAYINGKRVYALVAFSSDNPPSGFVAPVDAGYTPAVLKLSLRIGDRRAGTKLLDTYTPYAAYSLEDIGPTAYSGNVIKVRRTSDSNYLDTPLVGAELVAALESHGAGTNSEVDTWYDRSGNANHLIQSNTLIQPAIVSSGTVVSVNGKAALAFTSDAMVKQFTLNQPCTIFSVFNSGIYDGAEQAAVNTVLDGFEGPVLLRRRSDSVADVGFPSITTSYPIADNEQMVFAAVFNGASSQCWKNGVSFATGDAGSTAFNGITLDSYFETLRYGDNKHQCLIIFNSALSPTDVVAISESLASTYGL